MGVMCGMANDAFASLLVARDATSREVLEGLGVDLAKPTSFEDVFGALHGHADVVAADIATYRMTEKVLEAGSLGELLREAAARSALRVVFDWCHGRRYGGITQALIKRISFRAADGRWKGAGSVNSLFHPKLLLVRMTLHDGQPLRVGVLGSANMTKGGIEANAELGVVFAERGQRPSPGWSELQGLFEQWMSAASPLDDADIELLPENADELHEWAELAVPAATRLWRHQREAVDCIDRS